MGMTGSANYGSSRIETRDRDGGTKNHDYQVSSRESGLMLHRERGCRDRYSVREIGERGDRMPVIGITGTNVASESVIGWYLWAQPPRLSDLVD